MDKSALYSSLRGILSEEQIRCEEPMSLHTTFRVGGPADYFVTPSATQAADVIALCRSGQVPYQIIGNGSNLLVGDQGIRGVVIAFSRQSARVQLQGGRIVAEAGALLSQVAHCAYEAGLGGLEFAAGIPGSVGGGVVMNAGAYGGELKDVLIQVKVLDETGALCTVSREGLELSYRHSCIPEKGMTVLEAEFELHPKTQEEIQAQMDDYKTRRLEKQPLEYPSAGSTFKRPQGYYAGKLIMDAGLAGFTVGGAQVSAKHCGFVINTGAASAADIRSLIRQVQQRVLEKFGVALEMEVKCVGEF